MPYNRPAILLDVVALAPARLVGGRRKLRVGQDGEVPAPPGENLVQEGAALMRNTHEVSIWIEIRDRPLHAFADPGEVAAGGAEDVAAKMVWRLVRRGIRLRQWRAQGAERLPRVVKPVELGFVELHATPNGVALKHGILPLTLQSVEPEPKWLGREV